MSGVRDRFQNEAPKPAAPRRERLEARRVRGLVKRPLLLAPGLPHKG